MCSRPGTGGHFFLSFFFWLADVRFFHTACFLPIQLMLQVFWPVVTKPTASAGVCSQLI